MRVARLCSGLAAMALVGVLTGGMPQASGAAKSDAVRFAALDGGQAVVPHILVTAMAVQPDGIIYAGGAYAVRNADPTASSPLSLLGSAWMVSHNHGATWTQRVSTTDPHAFPRYGMAPWRDHTTWPIDFTPAAITVDPHYPRVIYAAGCTDSGGNCQEPGRPVGGPLVLRSADGGHSWQTLLSLNTIVKSQALTAALRYASVTPTQGFAVAVDPRTSRRLYAAVSGLGVLRSENGGRSWFYVAQPQSNNILKPCELLIDPQHPNTVFELAREGTVYRSSDAGQHWMVAAQLGAQARSTLSSLNLVGRTLYVTAARGIYTSKDAGTHWRLAYPAPMPGAFLQSIRGAGGWVSAFGPQAKQALAGLYVLRDGARWQAAADTEHRGPQYYGSLDFHAMDADLATRMWEDHTARIIFTSGQMGGLYRWQSSL